MSFIVAPQPDTTQHGVIQLDSLGNAVCKKLINLHHKITAISARVGNSDGNYDVVSNIRDVMTYPIEDSYPTHILEKIAVDANETFNYDLIGLIEKPALLRYLAPSNGYDWHCDISEGYESLRKISIIINLNDGYEGGDFELFSQGSQTISLGKGDVIAFSPFLPHRITPVTKGERWSLVAWIGGPCFR